MQLKCLQCGHEFDGWISKDELGWHSACPKCNGSFDVDVPEGRIIMAFAWDESDDCFTDFWDDNNAFATYYAFDTPQEFIQAWEVMVENPDGMWYWVTDNGELITSGACDPDDINSFNEHFNIGKEVGTIKIRHWTTDILDHFEALLDSHGILIPDSDRTGAEGEACLYGTTYGNLSDVITDILLEFAVEVRENIDYELDHYFL